MPKAQIEDETEELNPLNDLTAFQRDLLAVVNRMGGEDLHGLAIKEEMESAYDEEIHHSRLYPNLDELVEKGLIQKGRIDDRTNYYDSTRRGRSEFQIHLSWMDPRGEV